MPQLRALYPYKEHWDGYGYEYRSKATLFGMPLVHVSFKYRANRMPVVAKGIIAIGPFSVGVVNLSPFGVGLFCLSQFALAGFAVAQFAAAGFAICQSGLVIDGMGQAVIRVAELLGL